MEGFLGMEVWVTQQTTDYDEVTIHTRWNRKEDFVNWTKSQAFGDAHAHGKAKPEGLLKTKLRTMKCKSQDPLYRKSLNIQKRCSEEAALFFVIVSFRHIFLTKYSNN